MRTPIRLCIFATLAALATADQLVVTSSKDNTLYEDAAGALSNAKGENCFVGRSGAAGGGLIRRTVMAFDLSAIPPGATITSVTLQFNCSQANAGNATIELHRLLADWGEGTSLAPPGAGSGAGVPSTTGDATWIHRFHPSTFWTTAGGDFASTVSGSHVVSVIGIYTILSQAGMVADVQSWVDDPSQNFGWCLVGDESTAMTAKRFDTRESSTPGLRPLLTVDYTVSTTTFCTAKNGLVCGVPAIFAIGNPSATAGSGFVVSARPARSCRAGVLIYNTATAATPLPFQGGLLCVEPTGARRAGPTDSMGTPGGANCDGKFTLDLNTFAVGNWVVPDCAGNPAGIPPNSPDAFLTVSGTSVFAQYWGRDSVGTGSFVSDGVAWTVGP